MFSFKGIYIRDVKLDVGVLVHVHQDVALDLEIGNQDLPDIAQEEVADIDNNLRYHNIN